MIDRNNKIITNIKKWFLFFCISILSLCIILPFLWMVLTSFKTNSDLMKIPIGFFPEEWTLKSYETALAYAPFLSFVKNSVIVSFIQTIVSVFTASLAAFGFARINFWGRDKLFFVYIATISVPFAVLFIPTYVLIKNLGMSDSLVGLIIPGLAFPMGTFWMRQSMLSIPIEYEYAASIDGCNKFQMFFKVFFPMSITSVSALAIFAFMGSWNNYIWPLVILSDKNNFTLPLGLTLYLAQQGMGVKISWNTIMAATTMSILPIVVFFIAAQDFFIGGMTTGGIKG